MIEVYPIEGEDYGRDLVEVTRCQGCRWWNATFPGMEAMGGECRRYKSLMPPDGFCSEAKKKDDT